MRAEIANLVLPILHRALRAQQRLAAGHPLSCAAELTAFKSLLLTEFEARSVADFGADAPGTAPRFLGIRFALACWLDETLAGQPSWSGLWPPHGLELALFGTEQGAVAFWEQAAQAVQRPDSDACEGFFLCVHLGFRGAWRETPDQVAAWTRSARARLAAELSTPWPAPPALEMVAQAPPLRQRERLRRTLLAVGVSLGLLAPLAAWLLVRQLG